jgi:sugar lactone lactonase YvrE
MPTLLAGNVLTNTITTYAQPAHGNQAPASTISSTTGLSGTADVAFDSSHNMWVGDQATGVDGQILEFSSGVLGSSGSPAPQVHITTAGLEPASMAFDGSGNLWVSTAGDQIDEFIASQLTTSGTKTPHVVLTDDGSGSIDGNYNIDFLGTSLWATNTSNGTVVEFTASQLASTGNPTPAVTLNSGATQPFGLAFDSSSNLWIVNRGGNSLMKFAAADLAASGSPTPAVVISDDGSGNALNGPNGAVFDASGDLWVTNDGSINNLVEYTGAQLATTGDPAPHVTISSTATIGDQATFDSSGTLWLPSSGSTLSGLTSSQLTASTSVTPAVILSSSQSIAYPGAMALDHLGDLWVSNNSGGNLAMFTRAQVAAGGSPTPSVVLTGGGVSEGPTGMAFARNGDLWVADLGTSTVSKYTPAQLSTSGRPTPAVTISSNGTSLAGPAYLAIDKAGDLWVSVYGTNQIEEFTAAQLVTSGSPTPAVTLSSDGAGSITVPNGLAFDLSGSLWVASSNNELIKFTAAQLAASGSPVPAVTLSADGTSSAQLDEPVQLGFDSAGTLWVAQGNAMPGAVAGFTASQLAATGSPVPTYALAGSKTGLGAVNALALATPPAAPTNVTASLKASSISVSWTAPPTIPWAADYVITPIVNGQAGSPVDTHSSNTSYSMSTQGSGTFAFVVRASNVYGQGPGSTVSNTVSVVAPTTITTGYRMVASDGGVFSFGSAHFYGSAGALHLNNPIVGMAATPDGKGYWLVASDGGIFSYGDARFHGSTGAVHLNKPIVSMAATPDGGGYWLVASDGGIFSYGDARFHGSTGAVHLNKPIVSMAATPDGGGYWLVASDGGIFSYGDARFHGSTGAVHLNKPIVSMAATPDGGGYWLVASDGGIFSYGDAHFYGSAGALHLNNPIVGMAATSDGKGYWLVASDGGIFSYGDAHFYGSTGALKLNKPIVGMSL